MATVIMVGTFVFTTLILLVSRWLYGRTHAWRTYSLFYEAHRIYVARTIGGNRPSLTPPEVVFHMLMTDQLNPPFEVRLFFTLFPFMKSQQTFFPFEKPPWEPGALTKLPDHLLGIDQELWCEGSRSGGPEE